MLNADFTDIPNSLYPTEMLSPMSISKEAIPNVIKKLHSFNVASSNGIPFFVLECHGSSLVSLFKPFFQVYIDISYNSTIFCYYNTVFLKKPGKGDYSVPGAWQPIALLNTLGKVLESVMAQ